jgi:hypothetical protein
MATVCTSADFLALLYELHTQTYVAVEVCLGVTGP